MRRCTLLPIRAQASATPMAERRVAVIAESSSPADPRTPNLDPSPHASSTTLPYAAPTLVQIACRPLLFSIILDAANMMVLPVSRLGPLFTLLLSWTALVAASDTITPSKIKVQLFAAPSFLSEVSVDAYNNQCLSLDNNLYVCPYKAHPLVG